MSHTQNFVNSITSFGKSFKASSLRYVGFFNKNTLSSCAQIDFSFMNIHDFTCFDMNLKHEFIPYMVLHEIMILSMFWKLNWMRMMTFLYIKMNFPDFKVSYIYLWWKAWILRKFNMILMYETLSPNWNCTLRNYVL